MTHKTEVIVVGSGTIGAQTFKALENLNNVQTTVITNPYKYEQPYQLNEDEKILGQTHMSGVKLRNSKPRKCSNKKYKKRKKAKNGRKK